MNSCQACKTQLWMVYKSRNEVYNYVCEGTHFFLNNYRYLTKGCGSSSTNINVHKTNYQIVHVLYIHYTSLQLIILTDYIMCLH